VGLWRGAGCELDGGNTFGLEIVGDDASHGGLLAAGHRVIEGAIKTKNLNWSMHDFKLVRI
jgi:hypothetical protein